MWKIGSGEVSNTAMLNRIAQTRQPVLLSSGMSPMEEIDNAVRRLQAFDVPVAVLQCTTAYPCAAEKIGLNVMELFRHRYGCFVGLSDHSGTIFPSLAAVTLGADVVEVHVTMSREMFGPDVAASVTTSELRHMVDGIRFIEQMMKHPVDKDAAAADMQHLRNIFTKSVVARRALAAGTVLTVNDLAAKKPGTGIPGERLPEFVGRRLRRPITADGQLSEGDLES
jgi:N,N'-diacetyllegionaminate synthase